MSGTPLSGWDPKDPNDTLEYELDWGTNFLAVSETISSSAWSVSDGTGLVIDSTRVSGQKAYATFTSGVAGTAYVLLNRIWTSAGNNRDQSVALDVKDN
jgi:hypothetical protein